MTTETFDPLSIDWLTFLDANNPLNNPGKLPDDGQPLQDWFDSKIGKIRNNFSVIAGATPVFRKNMIGENSMIQVKEPSLMGCAYNYENDYLYDSPITIFIIAALTVTKGSAILFSVGGYPFGGYAIGAGKPTNSQSAPVVWTPYRSDPVVSVQTWTLGFYQCIALTYNPRADKALAIWSDGRSSPTVNGGKVHSSAKTDSYLFSHKDQSQPFLGLVNLVAVVKYETLLPGDTFNAMLNFCGERINQLNKARDLWIGHN